MSYIEINSDVLSTQREILTNQLSSAIADKKFYLRLSEFYYKNIDLLNVGLNGNNILINELMSEIRELEEKIKLLELSISKLGNDYNFMLNNYNEIDIEMYNDYRVDYDDIVNLLNKMIDYKDNLVKKYESLINDKKELLNEIKMNKKDYKLCVRNVGRCDYNIKSITKSLNNIDNVHFISNDKVSEKYITPKVKKLNTIC